MAIDNSNEKEIKFVPRNGWLLCCQGDAIWLTEKDNHEDYITEPHLYIPGALMLAQKSKGDGIYLDESECSIYDRHHLFAEVLIAEVLISNMIKILQCNYAR